MGRILFGGTAALLICIFLSPKFIDFLRKREFGQHIREDGPAGTPAEGRDTRRWAECSSSSPCPRPS